MYRKKGLSNLNHSTRVWDAIHVHAQVIVLLNKYVIYLFTSVQYRYGQDG